MIRHLARWASVPVRVVLLANVCLGKLLTFPVRAYRLLLSPILPPACRFEPSCSSYAIEALDTHGGVKGSWLTLRRLMRCQPWGGSGWDPVPAGPASRLPVSSPSSGSSEHPGETER